MLEMDMLLNHLQLLCTSVYGSITAKATHEIHMVVYIYAIISWSLTTHAVNTTMALH